MREYEAAIWLASIPSVSAAVKCGLYHYFGSALEVYEADKESILASHTVSDVMTVERLIASKKNRSHEPVLERMNALNIRFSCIGDEDYLFALKNIYDPPFGLFYTGNLPKNSDKLVAMVGARMCSSYGMAMAQKAAYGLSQRGIVVVSGMAAGIDAESHKGALSADGYTIAVLGCGVDICYPSANKKLYEQIKEKGCIISEYAPGTQARTEFFPQRNRIISGLSTAVIVIEAKKKSGSLITANTAIKQGRDVWAMPGRVTDALSEGTNELIAAGAGIFIDIDRFLEETFAYERAHKGTDGAQLSLSDLSEFNLEKEELLVYSCLDFYPKDIDTVQKESGLTLLLIFNALTGLSKKGLIRECFKNHYERIK